MKESSRIWLASSLTLGIHAGVAGLLVWHGAQATTAMLPAPAEVIAVSFTAPAAEPATPAAPPTPREETPQEETPPPTPIQPPAPVETPQPEIKPKPVVKPKPVAQHAPKKMVKHHPSPAQPVTQTAPTAPTVQPATQTASPKPAPVLRRAGANEHFPARYRGQPQAPNYPPLAVRRQMEGTTLLEVVMDDHGNVIALSVKQSTGYDILDRAAMDAVRQWKFVPPSGVTGPSRALVPVKFSLTN